MLCTPGRASAWGFPPLGPTPATRALGVLIACKTPLHMHARPLTPPHAKSPFQPALSVQPSGFHRTHTHTQPCTACRDWLSNELEPDPEQLEVNSRQTPQKRQAAAAVAAAAAGSDCDCHGPKRPAGGGCASSRAGEDGWPADSAGSRRESAQLLPGLPLVPRSPVSGQALPAPPSEAPNTPEADAVEAVRAQQPAEGPLQRCGPPAQQFQALAPADQVLLPCSLFDLAGLDLELQDLLG